MNEKNEWKEGIKFMNVFLCIDSCSMKLKATFIWRSQQVVRITATDSQNHMNAI